jgi:5-methylcytosine-specific restriction endonuclease McrA
MSQVASQPHRDPVEIEPRRMTPARRAKIIARTDGHCAYPQCEVTVGLEVDHIICLAIGGRDRDDNLEALCGPHHQAKTKRDMGLIAKAKRRALKARGEFPASKHKLKGRGFERRWNP